MKKATALFLSLALCISMTACSEKSNSEDGITTQGGTTTEDSTAQSPDLTGEISGEITVSCYDSMTYKAFLEDAARLFEEKYPDVKVNIESFSSMPEVKTSEGNGQKMTTIQAQDDPQGRADYISKINTSLMSGEGADIIAMDVLPVQKYIESGQLENLEDYMEADADFNRSDYRENILDAVKYQDGTWFLPLDYTFDYYTYDSTLLTGDVTQNFGTNRSYTIEQLISSGSPFFNGSDKLFNISNYSQMSGSDMFHQLLEEKYTSFVDLEQKQASFDDGSFEALLNSVNEYAESGYISQGVTGQTNTEQIMKKAGETPTNRYFFKPKNNFSLLQQFNQDSGRKMVMYTGSDTGIEEDDLIAGIQADENGKIPFDYEQAYGINANSQNKQTAWAFLKFLLSEEMQTSTNMSFSSLPLNHAAREAKAELVVSGAFMGAGEELDDSGKETLRQYKEAVEQLSDQINSYTIIDSTINDMISEQIQYFFDGSKTAKETAEIIQSKVGLYLSE